ncbi:hypothetical protein EGR_00421 [Echinococcus granulosus]|uniref:Uncharacterized protein n=1 Tax=Echinococcus granulosus TaxID=6210 RepID=W6UV07_ECHGR|nr:hypothetical protein EGR_00421 [Echinococcus granulosus]EUB64471.1 hypothetical protein EGR_00421 [Echinococcus granulosus]
MPSRLQGDESISEHFRTDKVLRLQTRDIGGLATHNDTGTAKSKCPTFLLLLKSPNLSSGNRFVNIQSVEYLEIKIHGCRKQNQSFLGSEEERIFFLQKKQGRFVELEKNLLPQSLSEGKSEEEMPEPGLSEGEINFLNVVTSPHTQRELRKHLHRFICSETK